MVPVKFTTGTSAPVWTQAGSWTSFYGVVATNAESAAYFIKLYWQKDSPTAPSVGVTVPDLTIPIYTTTLGVEFHRALVQNGPLWYTVTKNAGDTDATALSSGGDIITLLVE